MTFCGLLEGKCVGHFTNTRQIFAGVDGGWLTGVCVHMCGHTGAGTPIRPEYTVQDTYLRV